MPPLVPSYAAARKAVRRALTPTTKGLTTMLKVSPSILSADFTRLGEDIRSVQTADYLHFDVMDGVFVPNISFGLPILQNVRAFTDMPLDVHLMIVRPVNYVRRFCDAGADIVVFHVEADQPQNIAEAVGLVKAAGKRVGLSVKPKTPAAALIPYMDALDIILVMTVEPGFGGQRFMEDQLPKITEIRRMIEACGRPCELEVDGGINPATARLCAAAGADVFVAGSSVFGRPDRAAAIQELRG